VFGRRGLRIEQKLDAVLALQRTLLARQDRVRITQEVIMRTIDELLRAVSAQSTRIDSVLAVVAGLRQRIATELAETNVPEATQQKIDKVFDEVEANSSRLQRALDENVTAQSNQQPQQPEPPTQPQPASPAPAPQPADQATGPVGQPDNPVNPENQL
jgi:hypothetical protein